MKFEEIQTGVRVRIKKPFLDFDGQEVQPSVREVVSHSCFFYDDGHTLTFTDGSVIRLGGNVPENDWIMTEAVDDYWEILPPEPS